MSAPAASGESFVFYANSWIGTQGGYLSVFKMFLSQVAVVVLIAGIIIYTFGKNKTFEE